MKDTTMEFNPLLILMPDFDGSGVLYNPDSGETFALNRTAVFLYRQLQDGRTKEQALSKLRDACLPPVPTDEVLDREFDAFLTEMTRRGWVRQ